jgi:HD-like signal output (HDOD) protein/DNA-binding NarL/FixJ family response regulator
MKNADYRVLVVDDEQALRRLMVMALSKQGFACDHAENGEDALKHLAATRYHAVVSDLAMPVMHGHALATQILSKPDRPLLIVVTGVLEPRLAQDLLTRGVDDIVFKPIDFQGFALKLKIMLDRRSPPVKAELSKLVPAKGVKPYDLKGLKPISRAELDGRLANVASLVPISSAALDVYQLVTTSEVSVSTLTAAVERDGALVAEMLRVANSPLLNPSSRRIVELEDAILRLGTTRVAELAIAVSALSSMAQDKIPWMNLDLEWRRSIAAGVALEILLERTTPALKSEGLLLSVILHGMGRYIMATLYPRHYEVLLAECVHRNSTLDEAEQQVFPLDHAAVLSRLLDSWKIAPEIYRPLMHVSQDLAALSGLPAKLHMQAEVTKTALVLGQVALGKWQPWDKIDLPSEALLTRWRIEDIESIVQQIRQETADIVAFRQRGELTALAKPQREVPEAALVPILCYSSRSAPQTDVLRLILSSDRYEVEPISSEELNRNAPVLVNCLEGVPENTTPRTLADAGHRILIPARKALDLDAEASSQIVLPCSFAALKNACLAVLPPDSVVCPSLRAEPSLVSA